MWAQEIVVLLNALYPANDEINKIFRSRMTPVDFRNLTGRVGRIEYNLYGNVIFVSSQDEKLPETEYVKMLKEPVPEQTLSIDAGPKTLTNPERKYIVEALKEGNKRVRLSCDS